MNKKIIKRHSLNSDAEKSDSAPPLGTKKQVLKGDIVKALESAKDIIENAKQKAEEIISTAQEKASSIEEEAKKKGFDEGLSQLNETILNFKQKYKEILQQSERDLLKLSLKIAERIIGKAVEMDQSLILNIVKNSIQTLKYQKEIKIRVNPEDEDFLKKNKQDLYNILGESKEVEIIGDSLIEKGGCIIDTEIGSVDARLETQLKVMEKLFFKAK